nr:MFS transporter [Acetobacterium fimetarium]
MLLKNKNFIVMNLSAFINNYMMISVFYAVPIYLTMVTGETGMWKVFVPAIAIAIMVMKLAVRWTQRGFNKQILMGSFLISALSLILYFEKSSYLFLLFGTTLFMCGYLVISTIVATNVNNIAKDSYRGTANGIFNSFQYIGSFAGAAVTGALWGVSESWTWFVTMGIGIAGFLIIALNQSPQEVLHEEKNVQ